MSTAKPAGNTESMGASTTVAKSDMQSFDRLGLGINGLDHVRVLVRDLEAAKDRYRDVLGFRVPPRDDNYRHPLGSYQTVTRFSDAFYLELLAVHDRPRMSSGRPEMVPFLGLLQPRSERGPVGAFLAGRGQAGVMGVTLQTHDLRAQAARLEAAIGAELRSVAGRYGSSVIVPGAHACGLWLEFVGVQA